MARPPELGTVTSEVLQRAKVTSQAQAPPLARPRVGLQGVKTGIPSPKSLRAATR